MKAILFDLDETLILDETASNEAYLAAARLATAAGADAERLAIDAKKAAVARWAEGPYNDYCTRIGHSATEGLWAPYDVGNHPMLAALLEWIPTFRTAIWRDALAAQGITDEALPYSQAGRFIEARRRYPLYPEVPALIEALRARGYLLGIVTNGVPGLQRQKLEGCQIAHLFQASVVSGEIDCGKPDPGIFQHICRELGVELSECVMVGDNPARDVAGAMAAGMKSVWVSRNGRARDERFPGDLACTDLSAMLPWLDNLE